jgi:hypothetical protein
MIVFLYKELKSAPFALRFRTEKELKTILRAFEDNVNQIIEDNQSQAFHKIIWKQSIP